jgi:plastocyanin
VRRPPLSGPARIRWAGPVGFALLLAACAASTQGTLVAQPPLEVTIETAPGDELAFVPAEVRVPGELPVTITFRNASNLSHNLVFTTGITAATRTIVAPGTSDRLQLGQPAPGTHRFVCTIHMGMAGALLVEPGAASR